MMKIITGMKPVVERKGVQQRIPAYEAEEHRDAQIRYLKDAYQIPEDATHRVESADEWIGEKHVWEWYEITMEQK